MAFPFNDYVLFNNVNSLRVNGATDRSFDNIANVVDDGETFKADFQLFFKHKRIGAVAPVFQILNFQLDNDWKTQFNYGFMLLGARGPGAARRHAVAADVVHVRPDRRRRHRQHGGVRQRAVPRSVHVPARLPLTNRSVTVNE